MADAAEERKRLKREAKRAAKRAAPAAEEAAPADEEDEEEAAAARKRERKAAKRAAAAAAAGDAGAAAAPAAKKAKPAGAQAGDDGGAHARAKVGDHDAASRGAPIRKSFYRECDELASLSTAEVDALRQELHISVEPAAAVHCKPVRSFAEAGFPKDVLATCSGFKQPSPIQAQCWPIVMRGYDLVGIAATGSGKTLAFVLPILVHIKAQAPAVAGEPVALVLAPTRELAMQTAEVAEKAGAGCSPPVYSACIYGGATKGPQYAALKRGAQIVVATPGRLKDLMMEGAVRLGRATFLVLDEADRMLDLGFEPEIRALAGGIRADRQTVMFSATWPTSIQALAQEFLAAPLMVRIGAEGTRASHSITQIVEVLESDARDARLEQLLMQYQGDKAATRRAIIFVLYKKEATRVGEWLRRRGWKAKEIQGDMAQWQRTETVAQFKAGSLPLLIATDVAARGLDIPGVETVINYSFPLTIEDYVHRIGRTGRAGATGTAHTFFCQQDKAHAGELSNVLREAGHPVPPELLRFGTHVKKKESKLYGNHFKDIDLSVKAKKTTFGDDDD